MAVWPAEAIHTVSVILHTQVIVVKLVSSLFPYCLHTLKHLKLSHLITSLMIDFFFYRVQLNCNLSSTLD